MSLAFSFRKKSSAFSSPQAANKHAACEAVVPNSGLAIPIFPRHFGSVRSRMDFGFLSPPARFLFTNKILARAANPNQRSSGDRHRLSNASAAGEGYASNRPSF